MSTPLSPAEKLWIEARARAAGFTLAGLAPVPDSEAPPAQRHDARFAEFIEAGRAGEMDYLKRTDTAGRYLRGDLRRSMPWARSVLVCALNYDDRTSPLSVDPAPPTAGWIARYAWSGKPKPPGADAPAYPASDYHDVLLPPLQVVERDLRARFAEVETRAYVDTGPVVERTFAELAGVGWIGKNTCVLHPDQGSFLLLAVLVTSLELAPDTPLLPQADRCGTCTRCLEACPTNALIAPRQMDASLCIAYLTIEKKGEIPEPLRAPMGRQVFGCDICQDVCPWNARARRLASQTAEPTRHEDETVASTPPLPPRPELINPDLATLAALDGPAFNRLFRNSPLERTRRRRILRNVAVAMGNSGDPGYIPQLQAWASADSPEQDPTLAETAQWALKRLGQRTQSAESQNHDAPPDVNFP